jgi:hypothetical protein
MTSANRVQLAYCREVTPGVTPTTPTMRIARMTGEGFSYRPEYTDSEEIRADRMNSDPILVGFTSEGSANIELSYPEDKTFISDAIASALFSDWSGMAGRFNDGVADSIITGVTASSKTYAVTTGQAFVVGQLVQASGFTNALNNRVFRAFTGTNATAVVAPSTVTLADESAPPGAARLKTVGFQGAAGDITATATGLASTALDFTALGLQVGQFIKIGGAAAINKFGTASLNAFVRVAAIAENALTLDHLPAGWATDSGAAKEIMVFVPDQIKNGVSAVPLTFERGFLGQAVPLYMVNTGMHADQLNLSLTGKQPIKGSVSFKGIGGSKSTLPLDATPEAETLHPVMAPNANISRFTEAGAAIAGNSFITSLDFTVNNNLRMIDSLDSLSAVGIEPGECSVSGKAETYFGDATLLDKFYAGTPTSFACVMTKAGKSIVVQIPRAVYRGGGNPSATGKNSDVKATFDWQASKDALTQAHILINRFSYVE